MIRGEEEWIDIEPARKGETLGRNSRRRAAEKKGRCNYLKAPGDSAPARITCMPSLSGGGRGGK